MSWSSGVIERTAQLEAANQGGGPSATASRTTCARRYGRSMGLRGFFSRSLHRT